MYAVEGLALVRLVLVTCVYTHSACKKERRGEREKAPQSKRKIEGENERESFPYYHPARLSLCTPPVCIHTLRINTYKYYIYVYNVCVCVRENV